MASVVASAGLFLRLRDLVFVSVNLVVLPNLTLG